MSENWQTRAGHLLGAVFVACLAAVLLVGTFVVLTLLLRAL